MRKHLSVFALCIRAKALEAAAHAGRGGWNFYCGVLHSGPRAGLGQRRRAGHPRAAHPLRAELHRRDDHLLQPGYEAREDVLFSAKAAISERAFLLWDALAAALCFLLFYCAQILTVFGLACVYQRSAGYALGPQGVFLMLARDSFLHGLLPFGESVIWTRNILYMVCAGLSCAAASLARRNRNRGGHADVCAGVHHFADAGHARRRGRQLPLAGRRTDRHGHRLRPRADGGAQRKTEGGRR